MTLDTIVKLRLKRKPEQYAGASPNAIASGSKAQMMYFVEDAKSDIAALLDRIESLEKALERIAEGNLGDAPWQADYAKVKEVARAALSGDRP